MLLPAFVGIEVSDPEHCSPGCRFYRVGSCIGFERPSPRVFDDSRGPTILRVDVTSQPMPGGAMARFRCDECLDSGEEALRACLVRSHGLADGYLVQHDADAASPGWQISLNGEHRAGGVRTLRDVAEWIRAHPAPRPSPGCEPDRRDAQVCTVLQEERAVRWGEDVECVSGAFPSWRVLPLSVREVVALYDRVLDARLPTPPPDKFSPWGKRAPTPPPAEEKSPEAWRRRNGHDLRDVERMEGLTQCSICHGAEASLPTQCPGRPMSSEECDAVQDGKLDCRGGRWVRLEPKAKGE